LKYLPDAGAFADSPRAWLVTLAALWALVPAPLSHAAEPFALPPSSLSSPPRDLATAALTDLPGTAVAAVWRDGRIHHAGVRDDQPLDEALLTGPQAPLFEIGSITKVFTALLLAQAVERGELRLEDTLGELLKDRVRFSSEAVAAITLRQLVTHTACLPRLPADFRQGSDPADPYHGHDRARLWRALAAQTLGPDTSPPCEAVYSNHAFALLGELLAEREGTTWDTLIRERITTPLGMVDTVRELGDRAPRLVAGFNGRSPAKPWQMQAFAGAGALRSTAVDLLRFGRAVLAGRQGPLGAAAERLVTPLARFDGDIGYALFIRGPVERRTLMHNGGTGAFRSQLILAADTGEVLVVLASNAEAPVYRVGHDVVAARYPVTPGRTAPDLATLSDYPGVYRIGQHQSLTVVAQDGTLHLRRTGSAYRHLDGDGPDRFTVGDHTRLVFERDATGRVQQALLSSAGADLRGHRTTDAPPRQAVRPQAEVQALVGRYRTPTLTFDVRAEAGQLSVRLFGANDQPRWPVFPVDGEPDRYAYDVVKADIQFERWPTGQGKALVLHQNGRIRAVREDSVQAPD
jgi:CubicO group peptidase (beta-lactamase class C family)